jgi:hypothetical protein
MSCDQHLGGVSAYWHDDPAGSEETLAKWTLPADYKSPVEWSLLSSTPEGIRSVLTVPGVPVPGRTYRIYGWTAEQPYYSADGPEFTADDLAQLKPGEVLIEDFSEAAQSAASTPGGPLPHVRVSMDEFKKRACQ